MMQVGLRGMQMDNILEDSARKGLQVGALSSQYRACLSSPPESGTY